MKKLKECMELCNREMTLKEVCTSKCCNFCDVPYIYLEKLPAENERLKQKLEVCEKFIEGEWGSWDTYEWEEFYREHGIGDVE